MLAGLGHCTVHQRKLGCVEQLGGKVTGALCRVFTDRQVDAWVSATGKGEAQRIRAVVLHPIHRIDAVAQRLGHLAAVLIANQAVQEEVGEWNLWASILAFAQKFWGFLGCKGAEHHHAGNPEEQDVVGGDQHGGWVELLQLRGLFWPTHCRKWPQRRREPGI